MPALITSQACLLNVASVLLLLLFGFSDLVHLVQFKHGERVHLPINKTKHGHSLQCFNLLLADRKAYCQRPGYQEV